MTKIYLDETSIKNYINGSLENAITRLKEAKSVANALSIPYEFNYRSYLKNLDEKIDSDLDSIGEVYNKIKEHSKRYSNINNDVNNSISEIENYSISLRQSAIK